jgi:hypothetical protein
MASWTTTADIKAETERLWNRGELPAALLSGIVVTDGHESTRLTSGTVACKGGITFPYRLRLRCPRPSELGASFEDVRMWVQTLERASRQHTGAGFAIEWQEINTRALGRNRLPSALTLPSLDDALALIDKQADAARLLECAHTILSRWPALAGWVSRRPHVLLEHVSEWPQILDVVGWMVTNPRSGLYARQIDVAGVDTKFIESRKGLLTELLDVLLPSEAVEHSATGAQRFEARYGLATKPAIIRFRLLDPDLAISGLTDLAVPAVEFAKLEVGASRIFIVENEVTFLSFPQVGGGLLIFGGGYGIDRLEEARWLASRVISYWGDIDTHGFAILDRLRTMFPTAKSLLMDRGTLLAHRAQWSSEAAPQTGELSHLEPEEYALYDDLCRDRLGSAVRLEQERVRFGHARSAIFPDY